MCIGKKDGNSKAYKFLTLNLYDLSRFIVSESNYYRIVEDLFPKLEGSIIFTIVDMTKGFGMVMLDLEFQRLTTFSTPYERFQFTLLLFGLNVSDNVFQRKLHEII